MTVDIEVRNDSVTVEKVRIDRPNRISPDQWIEMWEYFRDLYGYNLRPYEDLIT